MIHTPFEKELLAEARRTNELLEYLLMALQPQKIMLGADSDLSAEALQRIEARQNELGQQHAEAVIAAAHPVEQMLAGAGILPMRRPPRGDVPETPEQRQSRFAERAKQVGMTDEAAATVSARVAEGLEQLTEKTTPAKKAAARRK